MITDPNYLQLMGFFQQLPAEDQAVILKIKEEIIQKVKLHGYSGVVAVGMATLEIAYNED